MRPLKNNVLVRISEAERRKMFEKPIMRQDGEVVILVTGIQSPEGFDKSYEQSVSIGEILAVGSAVEDMEVGDLVLLDYIVDVTPELVVSKNEREKVVCLDTTTAFYDKTIIADANRRTPHPTVIISKGDMKHATLIVAYVRDGVIYPLWPYVFLQHKPQQTEFKMNGKFFEVTAETETMVQRKVMIVNKASTYRPDDVVMCYAEHLFQRELFGRQFDIIYETDIEAIYAKDN